MDQEEFNKRVLTAQTLRDVISVYSEKYPGLLVETFDDVCPVYEASIRKNWLLYCSMLHIAKGPVLTFSKDYEDVAEVKVLCDMLTTRGALVRKDSELMKCAGCGLATPTLSYYKLLVCEHKPKWETICSGMT